MFLPLLKHCGFWGLKCIRQLNISVYIQTCQIKESLFPFEYTIDRKEEFITARCREVQYLMFSTQIFFKDPDSWPLLAGLASYLSGEDEVRKDFWRVGLGNIISNMLQKSNDNILVYQNCFNVLDTATDGKSENVIMLLKNNDVLKDEIRHVLRYLVNISEICEKVIPIMTKKPSQCWQTCSEMDDQWRNPGSSYNDRRTSQKTLSTTSWRVTSLKCYWNIPVAI